MDIEISNKSTNIVSAAPIFQNITLCRPSPAYRNKKLLISMDSVNKIVKALQTKHLIEYTIYSINHNLNLGLETEALLTIHSKTTPTKTYFEISPHQEKIEFEFRNQSPVLHYIQKLNFGRLSIEILFKFNKSLDITVLRDVIILFMDVVMLDAELVYMNDLIIFLDILVRLVLDEYFCFEYCLQLLILKALTLMTIKYKNFINKYSRLTDLKSCLNLIIFDYKQKNEKEGEVVETATLNLKLLSQQ